MRIPIYRDSTGEWTLPLKADILEAVTLDPSHERFHRFKLCYEGSSLFSLCIWCGQESDALWGAHNVVWREV